MKQVVKNDPNVEQESNLHNIYLQVLLDQGFLGFLILICTILVFIYRELPTLASNPLAGFILCYLCLGMIEYRFLDIPFWFIVGAYVSLSAVKKPKE